MPQNNIKPNDRPGFSRFRPRGDGDENTPKKGPKFNIYWIWAIIAIVLLGYNLVRTGFTRQMHIILILKWNLEIICLKKEMLPRLVLVTNKNLVRVYIKKDSLDKPYYKDLSG